MAEQQQVLGSTPLYGKNNSFRRASSLANIEDEEEIPQTPAQTLSEALVLQGVRKSSLKTRTEEDLVMESESEPGSDEEHEVYTTRTQLTSKESRAVIKLKKWNLLISHFLSEMTVNSILVLVALTSITSTEGT